MYRLLHEHLPNDWPVKKLSDLGVSYSGLKNKTKDDFSSLGNAKFINYKNINKNYFIDVEAFENVQVDAKENQIPVQKGDVFFTGSSETPQETGLSSVLLENLNSNVFLNSFSFGFRFNDTNSTSPQFFGYFFRGPIFRDKIYPLAQGSTRFNLSKNELLKLEVPMPPFKEQQKIAAILSSVDEAIDKTEQIIEQTERVKQGLMQQLLTRGIGHTEFKQTEMGEVPKNWDNKTVGDLVEFSGGSQPPRDTFINEPKEGYTRLIQIRDYKTDKYPTYVPTHLAKKFCDKEDIMIGRYGPPIFQILRGIKGAYNVALIKATPNELITRDYLYYFLSQTKLFSLIDRLSQRTSGQTGVDMEALKSYPFPLPPIEEQLKIGEMLQNTDNLINFNKRKSEKLTILKKALMQQLLTGKVRVPVDENEVMSQ